MSNGREVSSKEVSLADAKAIKGLRAVFGEVRVSHAAQQQWYSLVMFCCQWLVICVSGAGSVVGPTLQFSACVNAVEVAEQSVECM